MSLKTYTLDESEKWDEVVHTFKDYDVYYLSGYVKAFKIHGDGEPLLFYYEDEAIRGINVVMKRDISLDNNFKGKIPENTYFDFSTPYGYGGWLIEGDGNKDNLFKEYEKWCLKNNIISEFVRFELFTDYDKYFRGKIESKTHNVVRNLEMNSDDIWMDFKQKVRKNVKKANKYNLQIIRDPAGKYLDDFLRIYYMTMDRTEAKEDYYFTEEFFKQLNKMKDNVMYFHVTHFDEKTKKDIIISTELVIYGAENCYSYLGGTNSEYFDMRPNDFLKYEIIKWAKEKGLKNFVLGGGYGSDDGIFQYKICLAPNGIVDFYIGKKVFDEEKYNYLLNLRKETDNEFDVNTGFFPEYRG